jgi:Caspase domain
VSPIPVWYSNPANMPPARGTHALVIGTSHYPYRPFGLNDLSGAATSALCFAEWLRSHHYRPPGAPLASVRLLLAPTDKERAAVRARAGPGVPLPDRQNVLDGLTDWQHDCLSSPNNVAVLYVAGHGLQESAEGALALLHDEGRNPGQPFDAALDIERVRQGLKGQRAPLRQWYFVDACRIYDEQLEPLHELERPLSGGVGLPPRPGVGAPHAAVYFAASPGGQAFEPRSRDPSRPKVSRTVFGRSLLTCLKQDALRRPAAADEAWSVTASSLLTALKSRVEQLALKFGGELQEPVGGGTISDQVFTFASRPQVPFSLTVDPPDAAPTAGGRLFDGRTDREILPRTPVPIDRRRVPAGLWSLSVTFQPTHPRYRDRPSIAIEIMPPASREEVDVQ